MQLWQRDRAGSIDYFKRWVNLRLNYRLKGYFSRHCDMTQFTLAYSVLNHVNVYVFDDTRTLCEKSLAAGAHPKANWRMRTTGRRMRSIRGRVFTAIDACLVDISNIAFYGIKRPFTS